MPSDDDWVKLFESTIAMGIENLKLRAPVSARLYSADATRADDYALRCSWVRNLGHDVVPFKPVRAATDLSASLVRDNWYHGRYEEIRELVPEDTFDLIQRLDISWMRTPYIKKIETGALGAKNAAFVAFVSDPGYLYRADPACATNELLWNAQVATLGYIVRWNGELGFVGGQVDPGESLQQAALREAKEEIGASLDPAKLELFCSHSMTGKGEPQHTHLFLYRVSMDEMYQLRQQALAAPHSRTELAGFVIAHLVNETPDLLLLQKWAGTAREELQSLIRSGVVAAAG
jgi:8-oxo-dGTP pyrophosphatase MutT (NUDIX family)